MPVEDADGEHVVDVPAKLAARARLFDTGHNHKTDAHDAHAVAVVAVRTPGLLLPSYHVKLEALRMLVDRREIGLHTPADVHYGRADAIREARSRILEDAHAAHPERFVRKPPEPPKLPGTVWINKPEDKEEPAQ